MRGMTPDEKISRVHELRRAGLNIAEIVEAMGLFPATVVTLLLLPDPKKEAQG